MLRPLIIISLLFLVACSNLKENKIFIRSAVDSSAIPKDSTTFYFPVKPKLSFEDNSYNVLGLDSFTNRWFSHQLFALNEPILSNYPKEREVYRFTWLRTFNHPIAVRLEKCNSEIFINAKMCDRNGGFTPGNLVLNRTRNITEDQWKNFQAKFSKLNFWKSSPDINDDWATDGAEWILESRKGNIYHFLKRFSPDNNDFAKCCLYLISLAGFTEMDIPPKEIY